MIHYLTPGNRVGYGFLSLPDKLALMIFENSTQPPKTNKIIENKIRNSNYIFNSCTLIRSNTRLKTGNFTVKEQYIRYQRIFASARLKNRIHNEQNMSLVLRSPFHFIGNVVVTSRSFPSPFHSIQQTNHKRCPRSAAFLKKRYDRRTKEMQWRSSHCTVLIHSQVWRLGKNVYDFLMSMISCESTM